MRQALVRMDKRKEKKKRRENKPESEIEYRSVLLRDARVKTA